MEVSSRNQKTVIWGACLILFLFSKGATLQGWALTEPGKENTVQLQSGANEDEDVTPSPHIQDALSGVPASRSMMRAPLDAAKTNSVVEKSKEDERILKFKAKLEAARTFAEEKHYAEAESNLRFILDENAPDEFHRPTLLLLAKVVRDKGDLLRSQQIYSQFVHLFPDDPSVPEVFLRQGLIYRDLGATTLALTKFYSVMSASLNLKLDRLDQYKKLVLQAQTEVAETYYQQARYSDAADFFERLLKENSPDLNLEVVLYKQIRCLNMLGRNNDTISKGLQFLTSPQFSKAPEVPEVRFLVANSLSKVGRKGEALQQVYLLLQDQQKNATADVATWRYWQLRAGNEIANQLYLEKDYVNALSIYTCLANINAAPTWQFPVWYQIGLVYEQLQQPEKANEYYDKIINGQKDLSSDASSETLKTVVGLAKWRRGHLDWQAKAEVAERKLIPEKLQ